jgi:hypothetical protein
MPAAAVLAAALGVAGAEGQPGGAAAADALVAEDELPQMGMFSCHGGLDDLHGAV